MDIKDLNRDTVFLGGKAKYYKDTNLSKVNLLMQCVLKVLIGVSSIEVDKLIL